MKISTFLILILVGIATISTSAGRVRDGRENEVAKPEEKLPSPKKWARSLKMKMKSGTMNSKSSKAPTAKSVMGGKMR